MDTVTLFGHSTVLLAKGGSPSDHELQASIGSATDQDNETPTRKSELVEIQTPTARVLFKALAFFPFDLFPDEIIIDEIKVSIIYKGLIHRQYSNILIKDITDIQFNSVFFLAALSITGGEYQSPKSVNEIGNGPLYINSLLKTDAQEARRIILGLMIFSDQKVDTSKMAIEEIKQKASELGRARA